VIQIFRQVGVAYPEGLGYQGQTILPLLLASTRAFTPHVDLIFLTQIVKEVVVSMFSTTVSAAPITPIVLAPTNYMVTLVRLFKSIREMSCELYLRD